MALYITTQVDDGHLLVRCSMSGEIRRSQTGASVLRFPARMVRNSKPRGWPQDLKANFREATI